MTAGSIPPATQPVPPAQAFTLEIAQRDWLPAFGAYVSPDGGFESPARVLLNVGTVIQAVHQGDIAKEEVWRVFMDTLVHEVGHVMEHYLQLEFSEERVEGYVEAYRALSETNLRDRTCVECLAAGVVGDPEKNTLRTCPDCGGSGLKGATA